MKESMIYWVKGKKRREERKRNKIIKNKKIKQTARGGNRRKKRKREKKQKRKLNEPCELAFKVIRDPWLRTGLKETPNE